MSTVVPIEVENQNTSLLSKRKGEFKDEVEAKRKPLGERDVNVPIEQTGPKRITPTLISSEVSSIQAPKQAEQDAIDADADSVIDFDEDYDEAQEEEEDAKNPVEQAIEAEPLSKEEEESQALISAQEKGFNSYLDAIKHVGSNASKLQQDVIDKYFGLIQQDAETNGFYEDLSKEISEVNASIDSGINQLAKMYGVAFQNAKATEIARSIVQKFARVVAHSASNFADHEALLEESEDEEEVEAPAESKKESEEVVEKMETESSEKAAEAKAETTEAEEEEVPAFSGWDVIRALKSLGVPIYSNKVFALYSPEEEEDEEEDEEVEGGSECDSASEAESDSEGEVAVESDPEDEAVPEHVFKVEAFQAFVDAAAEGIETEDASASELIQYAAESFMGRLFQQAQSLASHAGREVVSGEDLDQIIQFWASAPGASSLVRSFGK